MSYSIDEHRHNFSVWAASTAARASKNCRFNVDTGRKLLEACKFDKNLTLYNLPLEEDFDICHRSWRIEMCDIAKINMPEFSNGVAAKLINMYLKARFTSNDENALNTTSYIHPPIDSMLLKEMELKDFDNKRTIWRKYWKIGWSNFSSLQYEEIIFEIKQSLQGQPFWKIEEYWPIHRVGK